MSLNAAQALSLATTLRALEEQCAQMQRLLARDTPEGALLRTVQDIPAEVQPALLDQLAALRTEIARVAATFHLTAEPRSARQTMAALLATGWQHLEDERPAKLRRYGPVDPAAVPALDAGVGQLITRIQTMQSLLHGDTTTDDPRG